MGGEAPHGSDVLCNKVGDSGGMKTKAVHKVAKQYIDLLKHISILHLLVAIVYLFKQQ